MIEKSFLPNKDKWFYDLFTWKGSIKNQVYVPRASHPPNLKIYCNRDTKWAVTGRFAAYESFR